MALNLHGLPISGTTAQRPGSATAGVLYYDTTIACLLVFDGANWQPAADYPAGSIEIGAIAAGDNSLAVTGLTPTTAGDPGGAISLTATAGAAHTTGTAGTGGVCTLAAGAGGAATAAAGVGGAGAACTAASGAGGAASHASGGNAGAGGAYTAVAGAGGAATGTGGAAGGAGGAASVTAGVGGAAAGTSAAGAGGAASLVAGAGGSKSGTGAAAGGAGGAGALTAGAGGNTASSGANAGGNGGAVTVTAGAGGNASAGTGDGGDGGTITLAPGAGGSSAGGAAGDPGRVKIGGTGLFALANAQTIDMADAQVALTVNPGSPSGTTITSTLLFVDANSAGTEDLLLPPEADCNGLLLVIVNTGGEDIIVKEDGDSTTICTLSTAEVAIVCCNGTAWRGGVLKET